MTSATIREEREEQQTQYYTLLLEEMYFKLQLIHEGSFEKSFCSFVVCCSLVVPKHGICQVNIFLYGLNSGIYGAKEYLGLC